MTSRYRVIFTLLVLLFSMPANAIYFPDGIAWSHPSSERFVFSLYLNMLGRAPQRAELNSQASFVAQNDTRQQRLALFRQFLRSREYTDLFENRDQRWNLYRAPDFNQNGGEGYWRYDAGTNPPGGFDIWRTPDAPYSQSVASALASYYQAYCFQGETCFNDPVTAAQRLNREPAFSSAHACADETRQNSQFEWVANNGTTYPRGIDNQILCMGEHYYQIVGLDLQRYQCDPGYVGCRRDASLDLQGQRSGRDGSGKQALFFRDGSRITWTRTASQSGSLNTGQTSSPPSGQQHVCADPQQATSQYRWRGNNGTTISKGVGSSIICMDREYYQIEGINLQHYACAANFFNCQRNPGGDLSAVKRIRSNGNPGLEFRNGTTVTLIRKQPAAHSGSNRRTDDLLEPATPATRAPATRAPSTRAPAARGVHDCAAATRRTSQFRWQKQDGTSTWPDGIDGRIVCLADSYYVIEGITLRHHQCTQGFKNCRANKRKDLIATRNSQDNNGYNSWAFANGDRLSLVSR